MIEVELGWNHHDWILPTYGYSITCRKETTNEEKNEMARWSEENIGYATVVSQVDRRVLCPYWVFYFYKECDAMAFKLRWS